MFEPVPGEMDFPAMEEKILKWWEEDGVRLQYLSKNDGVQRRFSFLDGPITANNPMGVHHAWGRTYKDVFQRYRTMKGYEQRYQNGFDCQGLWVEVEVEKELGLNSKGEIEDYGIAAFVEKCRERVLRFSGVQTEQSKRLGYWMD
jgi:isoleucyl-tRNA synthetase